MGTSREEIAKELAGKFTELATRFRRIEEQNHSDGDKQVTSAGAWGAKLYKQAVEENLLASSQGIECLWPPKNLPAHYKEFAWYGAWFSVADSLSTCDLDSLPPNITAIRMKDTGPGVALGKSTKMEWRTRAENYALLAEFFARKIEMGTMNAETTDEIIADLWRFCEQADLHNFGSVELTRAASKLINSGAIFALSPSHDPRPEFNSIHDNVQNVAGIIGYLRTGNRHAQGIRHATEDKEEQARLSSDEIKRRIVQKLRSHIAFIERNLLDSSADSATNNREDSKGRGRPNDYDPELARKVKDRILQERARLKRKRLNPYQKYELFYDVEGFEFLTENLDDPSDVDSVADVIDAYCRAAK